jgi:hypothetical protein
MGAPPRVLRIPASHTDAMIVTSFAIFQPVDRLEVAIVVVAAVHLPELLDDLAAPLFVINGLDLLEFFLRHSGQA